MPRTNSKYLPISSLPRSQYFFRVALLIALIDLVSMTALAHETLNMIRRTRYAEIHYLKDEDLYSFTGEIADSFGFWAGREKNSLLAGSRVDAITDAVMKLLDMRPVDLRFSIHIYRTEDELELAYRQLGLTGDAPAAFYFHLSKSISVSLENISPRILAHEIAHAVICAYFTSPPPARMQEVLAQYVDAHVNAYLGK